MIILTENTEFDTVRKAIEMGADSYLLKPLKAAQLKEELLKISGKLAEEKAITSVFTVENIFRGCLSGQIHPDSRFHRVTREIYGFTLEEPAAVLTVWLGEGYRKQRVNFCRCWRKKEKVPWLPFVYCPLTSGRL